MKGFAVGTLALAVMTTAQFSQAADDRDWYVGGKFGIMSFSDSDYDSASNLGLVAGLKLPDVEVPFEASLAVEGEYTTTIGEGDFDEGVLDGEWDISTFGVTAVLRTEGEVYFKGKAGVVYSDITADIDGGGSASSDSTDFTFGLGAGWMVSDMISVEAEFSIVDDDITFFSVGVVY